MKKKILISAAGTASAWHIISTIKKDFKHEFEVWACDTNPKYLVPSATLVDGFLQVPSIFEKGYYESMLNLLSNHNFDIFVPLIDFDVELFSCDNIDLKKINVKSTAPTKRVNDICIDKKIMSDYLSSNGLPTPKIYSVKSVDVDKDYFVKPRKGFGSRNAQILNGDDIKKLNDREWIIQEICTNPEVTIEMFFDGENCETICRERIEVKAGVCTKARIFHDNELHSIGERMAKNLGFPTASCIQVMKNQENKWVVTDVNLRIGAGTALSSSVGWELASASLVVWGELNYNPLSFLNKLPFEKYALRVFQEVVTL